jgi:hypothetical protein
MTNQRMVFPEPAESVNGDQGLIVGDLEEHTFAIDPQEGAGQLPFGKHTALEEPLGSSPVAKVARDVMI